MKVFNNVEIGFPKRNNVTDDVDIGSNAIIRSGTTIYEDVHIGDDFETGHGVLIRENTSIGDRVRIGSYSVIEGNVCIEDDVNIQSMVFISKNSVVGRGTFIGPCVVVTNDKYPMCVVGELKGAVIGEEAVIGAASVLLPGITIGTRSFVAAGSLVTRDVPDKMMAIGRPAGMVKRPKQMQRLEK
jgi:acetyltransferase-like isoleucine patch superfamily enzyme